MLIGLLASFISAMLIQQTPAAPAATAAPPLDYDFFRASVQPIFLAKRPGLARCYVCHRGNGGTNYLQILWPGAATWDDEQSRKNFEAVRRYVIAGSPGKSRLLIHPLAAEAGGDEFHGGGRQFASKDTAEWRTIAAWIRGEKLK